MGKLSWYLNRLKAMSPREVVWRVEQKRLQRREMREFKEKKSVLEPLYPGVGMPLAKAAGNPSLRSGTGLASWISGATAESAGTAETTKGESLRRALKGVKEADPGADEAIRLLGAFDYKDYATDWHAGFTTPARWPLVPSYRLCYKQRDDIGDARINWELNRHRQFVRLAVAGNITRLEALVDDWARLNPFLWGISWTSPMEIALRSISWMTAARVIMADDPWMKENEPSPNDRLVGKLLTGAANMTEYLTRHMSGFSSANNHLIVEAAAVALAGFLFDNSQWTESALEILDRELERQVSPDGADLESSLHYHGFVLEAYLLVWREMKSHGRDVSDLWRDRLGKMALFVGSSRVDKRQWCVFGDDDEARIMDAGFGDSDYYEYLLDLYGEVSGVDIKDHRFSGPGHRVFPSGGYSFMRRGGMFVGIDHAPLGFGSIAAHGHNDILSFQLFSHGKPVLVDSGTYLYHTDLVRRNLLRSTRMHNTVLINGMEQSQMLGPFLWGKKAESRLIESGNYRVAASVKGLSGVTHTRSWEINSESVVRHDHPTLPSAYLFQFDTLTVTDSFDRDCEWEASFILAPGLNVNVINEVTAEIGGKLSLTTSSGRISVDSVEIAPAYGKLAPTVAIRIVGNSRENVVTLQSL